MLTGIFNLSIVQSDIVATQIYIANANAPIRPNIHQKDLEIAILEPQRQTKGFGVTLNPQWDLQQLFARMLLLPFPLLDGSGQEWLV